MAVEWTKEQRQVIELRNRNQYPRQPVPERPPS